MTRTLLTAALMLLLSTTHALAADWSGDWRSFWRDGQALLRLVQEGNQVTGTYQPGEGQIEGTLRDGQLVARWREGDAEGEFIAALARDGRSFSGRFGNGEFWNGVRLTPGAVSSTPFRRTDTPRETLRTALAAANAHTDGDVSASAIWEPLLLFEDDVEESSRGLARRRMLLKQLVSFSTFRIHEAPASGEDGRASFAIGPAGTGWRFPLDFAEREPGSWAIVVPPLEALETLQREALDAMGFDDSGAWLDGRGSNPRQTMRDFLEGVATWHDGGAELALATLDLSDISPQLQAIEGPLAADFLRQIIDRLGFVIWQEIPDYPHRSQPYVHYTHGEGSIAIAPVVDDDGTRRWLFSRETLAAAPAIFEAIQTLPIAEGLAEPRPFTDYFRLRKAVFGLSPALLQRHWLLETWQWLALVLSAGMILLAVALAAPLVRVGARAVRGLAADDPDAQGALREAFVLPVQLMLGGLLLRLTIAELGLRRDFLETLGLAGALAIALGAATAAYRLTGLVGGYAIRRAETTPSVIDDIVASLATGLVKIAVVVAAIIAVAEIVGLPYEGVIAGIGVGGLALAIAARDTMSNFFGAAILMADRPFKRGDVVEIGGQFSVVESVGLRSTRLRTLEDSMLIIPNGKLADEIINNIGRRRQFRLVLEIGVTYDTPRDRLDAFVEAVRETFIQQPRAIREPVFVGLSGFAESAIEITLIGNLRGASFDVFVDGRHQLIADIVSCAERMGVSFAFPTRTLHIAPTSAAMPATLTNARQAAAS